MAVGCKIIRDFPRPARELVERFRGVATSNLVDVMGSCAAIDGALAPIGRGKLLGTAFPVRLPQGDNLMLHAAIDLAQPGDVLVIDAGGFSERAVLGELMASYCKTRGIRGIVCDGAIRDRGACADGRFSCLCAQRDAERSDESRTWRNWRSGRRGRKVGAARRYRRRRRRRRGRGSDGTRGRSCGRSACFAGKGGKNPASYPAGRRV